MRDPPPPLMGIWLRKALMSLWLKSNIWASKTVPLTYVPGQLLHYCPHIPGQLLHYSPHIS